MQRTTTGIRLVSVLLTAFGLICQVSVAQQDDTGSAASATPDSPPAVRSTAAPDPLADFDPQAETLQISLPNGQATALLRDARSGPAQGTVLMLPGNQRPYPGTAIEQLYQLLPEHKWQVVVLALAPLPASRHGQLFSAQHTTDAPGGDSADPDSGEAPESPATEPTAETTEVLGQDTAKKSSQPKTFPEWELDGANRIAGAIEVLQARGVNQLWLVGEGYGAQLVARFLADNSPDSVAGVSYINPRVPPALEAAWPNDPALPALDILDPRLDERVVRQRRNLAASGNSENYRQLRVAKASSARFSNDTLLSRRLRGWMSRQLGSAG